MVARARRHSGAARRQDVLLGRRRAAPRARAGPRRARRSAAPGLDRHDRSRADRDRRILVSLPRPPRLGLAPRRVRRRPGAGPAGRPGSISEPPWFARDALRTAAPGPGWPTRRCGPPWRRSPRGRRAARSKALAAGRMLTAQRTISVWLDAAAAAMDVAGPDLARVGLHARAAISDACRVILLDEAARACGSRPFARAGALDRARRDLEVFLLQHRLDPLLARAGEAARRTARRRAPGARDETHMSAADFEARYRPIRTPGATPAAPTSVRSTRPRSRLADRGRFACARSSAARSACSASCWPRAAMR